jgi:hypothetical protein
MLSVPAELDARQPSRLVFSRFQGREFNAPLNEYSHDQRIRVNVFVFAIQTQLNPAEYDMLDLKHWQFWVLDAAIIRASSRKSVDIFWVRRHANGPLAYAELNGASIAAAGT